MSDYLNYYGHNPDFEVADTLLWGLAYLGPILIPPVPPTCGMTDRNPNGTGTVYYLMWDGMQNLVLTDQPPRPYPQSTLGTQGGQDTRIYGQWEGPFVGNFRLGVTTQAPAGFATGEPRLQFDWLDPNGQGMGYTTITPPVVAPDILGPQTISFPEPSNYPAPGVPTIPGIPSTTPAPVGGGFAAFLAAYQTNEPPLLNMVQVKTNQATKGGQLPTPWHIIYFLAE